MAKIKEKESALDMRTRGSSIKEISRKLGVSKSTVSAWCKDITLSEEQIGAIANRSQHKATEALLRSAEKRRVDRLQNIEASKKVALGLVGNFKRRDLLMVGLGLYWGEGYKKGSQELGFTNSDPSMILFYIKWLRECFDVNKDRLILRVSINERHKQRIDEVTNFWADLTCVPHTRFTKPSFIKTASKKVYGDMSGHFGTLRIKVRKGTQLRREILAAINLLGEPR